MSKENVFEGWVGLDKESVHGKLEWQRYDPKTFDEDDVEIAIMYCGVCASDMHTLSSGWGQSLYPAVVGHEIVGRAVRVGSQVENGIQVGDVVGVGAQSDSCRNCSECKADMEPYCSGGQTGTYNGKFRRGKAKGQKSYGGYANFARVPSHFVFKIPDGLSPALAAPMLCGGVTVYSPLKQYGAGTTAKDVGIVGIGGLGHFGLLFAKSMGATVTAISHSSSKKADALRMGASRFIASGAGKPADFKPYARSLDLLVCTSSDHDMPLRGYLSLLRPGGHLILVGLPEQPFAKVSAFPMVMGNVALGGSSIGSPTMIREMLALAAEQAIHPWIERRSMQREMNQTVLDFHTTGAKYRYVMVNEANGGRMDSDEREAKL